MGWITRSVVVSCLLVVCTVPFVATAGAVTDSAADRNASLADASSEGLDIANGSELRNGTDTAIDGVDNVTNVTGVVGDVASDGDRTAENGTDGTPGDRTERRGPSPVALEFVRDGLDRPLYEDSTGDESDRLTAGNVPLVNPELPRLEATDSALVLDLRTVSIDGTPTLSVPLEADRTVDGPSDDTTTDGPVPRSSGPRTGPAGASAGETASSQTPTDGATDGSAAAGGPPDEGDDREDAPAGWSSPFDAAAPLEAAPALGTAMFAVVTRPWVGLFSGVSAIVANWFGKAFVLFRYGRHDGSDPLEHETRQRIHHLVVESPGRSLTELSEELDTPLSTVRHHVRILERERVLVTRKLRGNRRFYPLGTENAELAAALQEDSSAAVIRVLHEQGRATVGDVVERVDRSYSTVSYHLSRLADEGIVVQERDGRATVSRLDADVESLLESPEESTATAVQRSRREASAD